jgi:hypothetical protein
VWQVAGAAVIGQVGVFERIGAFVLAMTLGARFLYCILPQEVVIHGAVRLMTIGAKHLLFINRMMAPEREFGLHLLMALEAHVFGFAGAHDEVSSGMDIMAVRARR